MCTHTHTHIYMHTYTYAYIHTYIYAYACDDKCNSLGCSNASLAESDPKLRAPSKNINSYMETLHMNAGLHNVTILCSIQGLAQKKMRQDNTTRN